MKKISMPKILGAEELFTDKAENFEITCFPWGNPNGYEGKVFVSIGHSEKGLHVGYTVYEKTPPRAIMLNNNDAVCTDSCVEFFFRPDEKKEAPYVNFEMNSIGTLLAKHGLGNGKYNYVDRSDESIFEKRTSGYDGEKWQASFCIPYTIIESCFPDCAPLKSGSTISCNFYKCGDHTEKEHYIAWNNIDTPKPKFHTPSCFGEVTLL